MKQRDARSYSRRACKARASGLFGSGLPDLAARVGRLACHRHESQPDEAHLQQPARRVGGVGSLSACMSKGMPLQGGAAGGRHQALTGSGPAVAGARAGHTAAADSRTARRGGRAEAGRLHASQCWLRQAATPLAFVPPLSRSHVAASAAAPDCPRTEVAAAGVPSSAGYGLGRRGCTSGGHGGALAWSGAAQWARSILLHSPAPGSTAP